MASEYRTRLEDEKLPAGPAPTGREPSPVAANDLPTYEESEAGEQRAVEVDTMNSTSQSRPRTNKAFGERFHKLSSAAGTPLNKLSNFVGAEGWWPTTTEKECDKAARILYSFTRTGVPAPSNTDGPKHPLGISKKSLIKIPPQVLKHCAGLAIFNVARCSVSHFSLAGGSGVVLARRPDGTWSPPSTFLVSTLGCGFAIGLDIYECVMVLNTAEQVNAFARARVSLGGDTSVAIGPLGAGGSLQSAVSSTARPMWSYIKSRGLWAGVQVDGTVMLARQSANEAFYGERGITVDKILKGDVAWPMGGKSLFQILAAIDGKGNVDESVTLEATDSVPPPVAPNGDEKDRALDLEDEEFESALDEKRRLAEAGY